MIRIHVTYITPDNESITIEAKQGTNLLDLAHSNNIDLEGTSKLYHLAN